ncbi:ATP-dependent RNA helicase HrpA [Montanilutibacter psychrotolerans]|uniref:ATP-dependent RNA helicase HrpA n=1 Tax=Montanilutibacter psychrotolerans TaxID=1327343 RepID=A0A3M8SSC5_9GAMM|nr:ATP-dependent RNA helicase HrpA [Lysobacter psychrotolerans]RNF84209.1 ATP-dependent RNA helicase HrpA [Lysobacter psychrotolerans]
MNPIDANAKTASRRRRRKPPNANAPDAPAGTPTAPAGRETGNRHAADTGAAKPGGDATGKARGAERGPARDRAANRAAGRPAERAAKSDGERGQARERKPAAVAISPARQAELQRARAAIDGGQSRDRGRLHGLWSRWSGKPDDAQAEGAFAQALALSVAARASRAAALPNAPVDPVLPIATEAERIVELIRAHPVVVIAGETGSGKTTQLPKLCLAAGRGAAGMIGCTQPRRIAARAVAKRVAEELDTTLGGAVGYQVRFNENVGERTAIKFMTDGILLAEIQSDRWLSQYDTILIDEAHERSLNIDFLLGYLKQLLRKRHDLKVIVTSATIDTERFAAHFDNAPVVNVEGRGYPVSVRYRPLEGEGEDAGERSVNDGIVAACDEITREDPRGDVLVFLSGEREIRDAHQALERRKYRETEVLPLYARLSVRDQDRVFNPGVKRRIVLATNVAETSLTVPRIRYVVDPGLARVKRYSPRGKLDRLHIEPISQASADQRKGRCGRISEGTCYRLYDEPDFESRPRFTDPEIRRAALAGVILRMLSLGLGRIEDFPFLEPPDPRAIADGWQQLGEMGAVDMADDARERKLTAIGRQMARLPVDVKLARMLVAANQHGCLREMLAIASFLGIQEPRERPADQRAAADNAHAEFADSKSEFVGILKLWDAYQTAHEELTQSKLRSWCEKHFLGFLRMREWRELHRQLKLMADDLGWQANGIAGEIDSGAYTMLHRALIAGLPTQIGHRAQPADKKGGGGYDGPRGRKFQLFPGSPLAKKPPPWVLAATLLDTERVWSMTNAAIEPDWAIQELEHLLARRHHEPHWARSQGRVVGSEQISLFGLVLAPKRPVHYGALYPEESRVIFARDALVTGEINTRTAFVQRNLATLAKAREEEAKQRRAGVVVDEEWMAQWYLDRLPAHVHNAHALDAWYGKLDAPAKAALEWSLADLMIGDESEAARFPAWIALGDARLAVQYRFDPGAIDDGMTVAVPLHLLNALDPVRLSWLAPGFVADKAAALIRSLPKAQRRNFVPAPDFARAFHEAYAQGDADSFAGTLARFLRKVTGAELNATEFDESTLEPHLRINLRLFDRDGKTVLADSRDLDDLRQRFGTRAAAAFAAKAADGMARSGLVAFPETPIPASVPGAGGVPAYPALHDDGDSVSLRVHAERAVAQREHPRGVRRLLAIALADKLKQARKQLPVAAKTGLLYAAIESQAPRRGGEAESLRDGDRLRADLVDGAFAALVDQGLDTVRDNGAFAVVRDQVGRQVFGEAMERLRQAEAILTAVGEARAKLESPLMGWASGNLDDMRSHLATLTPPGFLRDVPASVLREYPRYLKALALRGERALRDPVKDQARMLEVKPFSDALAVALERGDQAEGWQALRWEIEELRVQLFAQELGTRGAVSPKKLATRLAQLR